MRSLNRVHLIHNPSDPAERAKGCTCREYFHTGLPCIHIAWLVNHLGKDINNYIPQKFTVSTAKAIYSAKVSSFSDDLLKGIKLSPRFDGPLLPAKFMWKAGAKKGGSGENEEEAGGNGNNTGTSTDKLLSEEDVDDEIRRKG